MPELARRLFSSDGFMPHGHCYLWNPGLVWLHVVSDALIALAYTSIPFTLVYFVRRRRDIPFNWMFLCFGLFIVACGATHVMEIWTLWTPVYWLAGAVKATTAAASVPTAILLVRLVPKALAIPTAEQLRKAHDDLQRAHELLEARVEARTAELVKKNEDLATEVAERQRAEGALRASEARFRRLAEAGIIGVLSASADGRVLHANDSFLGMVGYTRDDVLAGELRLSEMTPPEWRDLDERAREQLRTVGIAAAREKEYIRKDGSRVPTLVGVAALEGGAPEYIAFTLDLTELKRAEEAIKVLREAGSEADAKFRGLLESAPDAMVIVDRDGQVVLINAQAERLFGYPREELIGQSVDLLVPHRFRAVHPAHRTEYAVNPQPRAMGSGLDLLGRRKDGAEFPVEISLSPLRTRDGVLVSSAIRDITERRRVEEELRRARDVAEMASRELEAFSYSVAHDLRAPLRGINGYSVALLEDLDGKLDAEADKFLRAISAEATRMGLLIDALLGLSRVSRTELARHPVDLTATARSVIADLQRGEPSRVVECAIAEGLVAPGDPALLRVLFENLLGNAWKFVAKRESAQRIEVGWDDAGGCYFVRDNGSGFDMAYSQKLFVPFQRLHTQSEFAGTGIGLATVDRIVRRHGGKIWAEGAVNRGATFHFTLHSGRPERT